MYAKIKINGYGPFYISTQENLTILTFAQQLALYANKLEAIGLKVLALEISDKGVVLNSSEEADKERARQAFKLVDEILNIKKIAGIQSP